MIKEKKCCGCKGHSKPSYTDELKVDLKKAANEVKDIAMLAKKKFDTLSPDKKKQLKKNLAIGAGVIAGLWGAKKIVKAVTKKKPIVNKKRK